MGSVMKVKPLGTAFVDSSHATENFSNLKKTLAGSFHETPSNLIMYKTLLTFDLSMVYFPIEFAHLCLYVKDINTDSSYYSNNNLCFYKNMNPFDINTVTWNTTPETSDVNQVLVDENSVGSYIKIDVSRFVNSWIDTGNNYGMTIESHNYYTSLIKFASLSSNNPPWLLVQYKDSTYSYTQPNNKYHSNR